MIWKAKIKKFKITQPGFTYLIWSKPRGLLNLLKKWKIEDGTDGNYTKAVAKVQVLLDKDRGNKTQESILALAESKEPTTREELNLPQIQKNS